MWAFFCSLKKNMIRLSVSVVTVVAGTLWALLCTLLTYFNFVVMLHYYYPPTNCFFVVLIVLQ